MQPLAVRWPGEDRPYAVVALFSFEVDLCFDLVKLPSVEWDAVSRWSIFVALGVRAGFVMYAAAMQLLQDCESFVGSIVSTVEA